MMLRNRRYLQLGLILLAAFVVHVNTLRNGFIYDDLEQILNNRWLLDPASLGEIFTSHVWGFSPDHPITNYYRPLMHTANLFVYTLFGPNPVFFHLLNLLLHLGCTALLYLVISALCRKFCESDDLQAWLPFFGVLFFAVYPANSEAVAWLGSSGDLLCAFFILATFLFYLSFVQTGRWRFQLLSILSFACALLAKETAAITVPALLLVFDFSIGQKFDKAGLLQFPRRYLPYAVVGVLYLLVRLAVLGALIPLKKYTLGGSLFAVSTVQKILWYVGTLIWPFNHNFYPELKSPVSLSLAEQALGAVLLLVVIGALVWLWQNRVLRIVSVLIVVPLFSALQAYVLRVPVAERYLYLPSMGFCLLVAWLVITLVKQPRVRVGLAFLLVLGWGGMAAARNSDFVDGVTLWGDTVAKSPGFVEARSWYAQELFKSGRIEEGVAQAKIILESGSDDPGNIYQLADGLRRLGRYQEALAYNAQLLRLNPEHVWAHAQIGQILQMQGDVVGAIEKFRYALQIKPTLGEIQYWLGLAYERAGQAASALYAYRQAEKLLPADAPERQDLLESIKKLQIAQ